MSCELTPIQVNDDILDAVASGSYYSPYSVLGAHLSEAGVTVRTMARLADAVDIITPTGAYAATHERGGIWVAVLPGKEIPPYRLSVTYGDNTTVRDDPYRYLPTLGEMDTYLISEGRHENLWHVLGAHVKTYTDELGETTGTAFAVWAPNARAVRVVGEFNFVGRRGYLHAVAGFFRHLGDFRPRRRRRHALQVRDPGTRRQLVPEGRPAGSRHGDSPGHGLGRHRLLPRVDRRRVDVYPQGPQPPRRPHVHLRGPRGFVASGPGLPRAGRRAGPLRQADGLHARGVHAAG